MIKFSDFILSCAAIQFLQHQEKQLSKISLPVNGKAIFQGRVSKTKFKILSYLYHLPLPDNKFLSQIKNV